MIGQNGLIRVILVAVGGILDKVRMFITVTMSPKFYYVPIGSYWTEI